MCDTKETIRDQIIINGPRVPIYTNRSSYHKAHSATNLQDPPKQDLAAKRAFFVINTYVEEW